WSTPSARAAPEKVPSRETARKMRTSSHCHSPAIPVHLRTPGCAEKYRECFAGITWPKLRRPEPDPLTAEERERLLAWFAGYRFGFRPGRAPSARRYHHPAYHAYVHTLFWTGLQPSEASGLQWRDVDLRGGRLHVQRHAISTSTVRRRRTAPTA